MTVREIDRSPELRPVPGHSGEFAFLNKDKINKLSIFELIHSEKTYNYMVILARLGQENKGYSLFLNIKK